MLIVGATALGAGGLRSVAATLLVLGVSLPSLNLQECWRRVGFMRSRARASTANDCVFLVLQVAAIVAFWRVGRLSPALGVAAWGIGATTGAALGFLQFSCQPSTPAYGVEVIKKTWAIGSWLAGDFAVKYIVRQGYIFIIAAVAGTSAVGGLLAMQTLTGPTNVVAFGMAAGALARGANAMRADGLPHMIATTRAYGCVAALTVAAYCGTYVVLARPLILHTYGAAYFPFLVLVTPIAVQNVVTALDIVPETRLRILKRTKLLFWVRIVAIPLALGAAWQLFRCITGFRA